MVFLGEGSALPLPDWGIVCVLEVGDAKPIYMRCRSIPADLLSNLYELLKLLLETGLIGYSNSEWTSVIDLVEIEHLSDQDRSDLSTLLSEDQDIQRELLIPRDASVNLTLSEFLKMVTGILVMKKNGTDVRLCIDFRHYVVHDFGHGKWVLGGSDVGPSSTDFGLHLPLGHFQWKRMPFRLKNAALIYQPLLDNWLWGFVRLSPEEERLVDPEVLEFLGISPEDSGAPVSQGTDSQGEEVFRTSTDAVFHQNRGSPEQISYIDDIIYGDPSWDDLCKTPSEERVGVKKCKYLGHDISSDGNRMSPKLVKKVINLSFPKIQKGVQSFLGSLDYYTKCIEDLPILAATLYKASDEQLRSGDIEKPKHVFKILKDRLVSTPLLQHLDPGRQHVTILHANVVKCDRNLT
ncbi:reverse transcriptase [Phytophthora megakarya]|uniref:Reverse transcriptase n=1 Tax=Phytophthora megakarya TaxID=4795 RepID=A0A225WKT3_9STRA|nr:reverse transcriptase [Phytophthora megakarya]